VTVQVSPLASRIAEPSMLVNVPWLVTAYFTGKPDPAVAS
jgi:phosphoglucomutase